MMLVPSLNRTMLSTRSLIYPRVSAAVISVAALLLGAASALAGPKEYQITGSVLALSDTMVTLQTRVGGTTWEIGRDAGTKGTEALKVGDRVTVHYTMTAGFVEPKPEKAPKKPAAPAASPAAASPAPTVSPAH